LKKTTLGEISEYIQEVYRPNECFLSIKIDMEAVHSLFLEITIETIRHSILISKLKLKPKHVFVVSNDRIRVYPIESEKTTPYYSLQSLKLTLPKVVISGITTINRAVVNTKDTEKKYLQFIS